MYYCLYRATWLVTHVRITVISLLFSYIPAFMTDISVQVSKIPLTCTCSRTVACTLRMYNVLHMMLIIACKVISGKCIHTIYHSTRLAPQCHTFHLVNIYIHVYRYIVICIYIHTYIRTVVSKKVNVS